MLEEVRVSGRVSLVDISLDEISVPRGESEVSDVDSAGEGQDSPVAFHPYRLRSKDRVTNPLATMVKRTEQTVVPMEGTEASHSPVGGRSAQSSFMSPEVHVDTES